MKKILRYVVKYFVIIFFISLPQIALGVYEDFKEIHISKSPDTEKSIDIKKEIVDFCILPDNSNVTFITRDEKNALFLWNYHTLKKTTIYYPNEFIPIEIISHPQDFILFILGKYIDSNNNTEYKILRYDIEQKKLIEIYQDKHPISNLIISHAKFYHNYTHRFFRLFFARKEENNTEILTINENGEYLYPTISNDTYYFADWMKNLDGRPDIIKSSFGIPVAFHPAGSEFYWRKKHGSISARSYAVDNWGEEYTPNFTSYFDDLGNIEFSPNGMYLLIWKNDSKSLSILNMFLKEEKEVNLNYKINSKIRFTPDGRGIVFIKDKREVIYRPLDLPLYDVENAWMYCTDKTDIKKFSESGGLFRKTDYNQMYSLYESENYVKPGRPYLVTTDPFHEILEAAYAGLFYINERDLAIGYFNEFLRQADQAIKEKTDDTSKKWARLFSNSLKILAGVYDNEELLRVKNETGVYESKVLNKKDVNYAEFKPRGYYEQDEDMSNYFKAVQYISMAGPTKEQWQELLNHKGVVDTLKKWIDSYQPFIPPSRQALLGYEQGAPQYVKHKPDSDEKYTLFPKAWGIDNEILDSVVFHSNWPEEDQVMGKNGEWRLFPDLNELAYIFGNNYSKKILEEKGVLQEYPILDRIHKDLITRWKEFMDGNISGVYNYWLLLISRQFSGAKPDWPWLTEGLWATKQIQTGLASWTNLRHATVLVNQRGGAEAGEGGFFELIYVKPPRGAVEPHPEAFQGLIIVFEELKSTFLKIQGLMKNGDMENNELFKTGIVTRLDNVISNLKSFKTIAEKELNNEPLTDEEYELILYCGRAVEHDFLIFKGIMMERYGLANPAPISKTVDIYGNYQTGILHSAIGLPLEWDLIVPYFGRRQIVKGGVYSLYSFVKPDPISDKDWRSEIEGHELPDWIKTFISENELTCPAITSFTK